jgi:DEAD/DEAH box helicase domain-containing protein
LQSIVAVTEDGAPSGHKEFLVRQESLSYLARPLTTL